MSALFRLLLLIGFVVKFWWLIFAAVGAGGLLVGLMCNIEVDRNLDTAFVWWARGGWLHFPARAPP